MTALPPPPVASRPRLLTTTAYLAVAGGSVFIAALLGAYLALRDGTPTSDWPAHDVPFPNVALLTLTVTLVMSAVSALWIVNAARGDDRRHQLFAIALTVVFGAAHINGLAFVWSEMGLGAADSAYATLVYAITGAHTALLGVGLIGLIALLVRSAGGQLVGATGEPATAAVVWWEFVVAAWLAVYAVVFLVK